MFSRFRVYRFGEQLHCQSTRVNRREWSHDSTLYMGERPTEKRCLIMLEEVGLPYEVRPDESSARATRSPPNISPSTRTIRYSTIIDTDGPGGQPLDALRVRRDLDVFSPRRRGHAGLEDMRQRYEVIQWLMFQMGGVGPMFGQANYFLPSDASKFPTPLTAITRRRCGLYKVLDQAARQEGVPRGRVLHLPTSPRTHGFGATRCTR